MLTRFFTIIIAVSFCTTAFAQDTALEAEAARFAKEAEFLHSQGRYEAALEAAETAAALDPGNIEIQQVLIKSLIFRGLNLLQPSGPFMHILSADAQPKVELETARLAFHLADRAVELGESLGERDSFQGLGNREVHGKQDIIFGLSHRAMSILRCFLNNVATNQYPELEPESNQINRRLLNHWLKHRFQPMLAKIHDAKSCEETLNMLFSEAISFDASQHIGWQTTADLADAFEEMIPATLRLTKEWNIDPPPITYGFCTFFSGTVTRHRNASPPPNNPKTNAAFERTIVLLENDTRPIFRYFGWMARNKPFHFFDHQKWEATQQSREYFANLIKLLNEQPLGMSIPEREYYYHELRNSVVMSNIGTSFAFRLNDYDIILETACQRCESVPVIVMEVLKAICEIRSCPPAFKNSNEDARFLEIEPRIKALVAKQIELAENEDKQAAGRLKLAASLAAMSLDSIPPRIKPWTGVTEYKLTSNDGMRYYATLRGETLYLYKIVPTTKSRSRTMRLDQMDLQTGNIKSSTELSYQETPAPHFPLPSNATFVDDQNAYFGSYSSGILVFPLDGSEPWQLNEEDGLPSNTVQALGSIGGRLYAGLGDEKQTAWLIAVDLATRKIEMLASSSGREGKVPFYNLSPAPRFPFFIDDAKHNRLLMFVDDNSGQCDIAGLWAIDSAGNFSIIKRLQSRSELFHGYLLPDGNRILLVARMETFLMDLNDPDIDTLPVVLCSVYPGKKPLFPDLFLNNGVVFNGYLWGSFGFMGRSWDLARISLDSESVDGFASFQELQFPGQEQSYAPYLLVPTPDGKGLVVGWAREVFILHFE